MLKNVIVLHQSLQAWMSQMTHITPATGINNNGKFITTENIDIFVW